MLDEEPEDGGEKGWASGRHLLEWELGWERAGVTPGSTGQGQDDRPYSRDCWRKRDRTGTNGPRQRSNDQDQTDCGTPQPPFPQLPPQTGEGFRRANISHVPLWLHVAQER